LPDTKDDICARLRAILHRKTGILQKPSAFFVIFERCEMDSPLQGAETRGQSADRPVRRYGISWGTAKV
jgi:hypothetical protein